MVSKNVNVFQHRVAIKILDKNTQELHKTRRDYLQMTILFSQCQQLNITTVSVKTASVKEFQQYTRNWCHYQKVQCHMLSNIHEQINFSIVHRLVDVLQILGSTCVVSIFSSVIQ